MKTMAFVIAMMGLMISGSAKADQVCGMVVAIHASENKVVVNVETKTGQKVLTNLDNTFSGTASSSRQSANTNIVNIATTAMNNPGSLDFCANTAADGRIVTASAVNRFKVRK